MRATSPYHQTELLYESESPSIQKIWVFLDGKTIEKIELNVGEAEARHIFDVMCEQCMVGRYICPQEERSGTYVNSGLHVDNHKYPTVESLKLGYTELAWYGPRRLELRYSHQKDKFLVDYSVKDISSIFEFPSRTKAITKYRGLVKANILNGLDPCKACANAAIQQVDFIYRNFVVRVLDEHSLVYYNQVHVASIYRHYDGAPVVRIHKEYVVSLNLVIVTKLLNIILARLGASVGKKWRFKLDSSRDEGCVLYEDGKEISGKRFRIVS